MICRACKQEREAAKSAGNICVSCLRDYQRDYRAANIERLRQYWKKRDSTNRLKPGWTAIERARGRAYWRKLRHEAIMAYGGYRCACCGETEPAFLSLDHIANDGAQHRRALGYGGNGKGASTATLAWLRRRGYPEGIQVLCMNCNFGKQVNGGTCPHSISKTA